MISTDLLSLLQSSGPMPLDELVMRSSEKPDEFTVLLDRLNQEGKVTITGPNASKLSLLNEKEILASSDTFVEPSSSTLRSFFRA